MTAEQKYLNQIKQLSAEGKNHIEIGKIIEVVTSTVGRICRKHKIKKKRLVSERDLRVISMYLENYTLEEVGQTFDITRERVRQILNKHGIDTSGRNGATIQPFTPKNGGLTFTEYFWSRVDIKELDECWEWQKATMPTGYGSVRNKYKQTRDYAHRVAFYLHNRRYPKLYVLHSCDNPPCCNPHHLREGTAAENAQDRHERNYDLWYENMLQGQMDSESTLNREQVHQVIEMSKRGHTQTEIANEMECSAGVISNLLNGKTIIYKKFLENV